MVMLERTWEESSLGPGEVKAALLELPFVINRIYRKNLAKP